MTGNMVVVMKTRPQSHCARCVVFPSLPSHRDLWSFPVFGMLIPQEAGAPWTKTLPTSPLSKEKPPFCLTMKIYSIPLGDCQVHQGLWQDLIVLNKKHEVGDQKYMLSCEGSSKGTSNLVKIPSANNIYKIKCTARYKRWIYNMLVALGNKNSTEETLYHIY